MIDYSDFENVDRISIEDYGFSLDDTIATNQFSVSQDLDKNETYISIDTDVHTIENLFTIDGIFYLSSFHTETESGGDINLKIILDDLAYVSSNGDDVLGPLGEWWEQDVVLSGLDQNYVLTGGQGNDVLGGGSQNDILDGGEESFKDQFGKKKLDF